MAHAGTLSTGLKPLGFLIGEWRGEGAVAETGGTATGVSHISADDDGNVILRRDHTDLFDKAGKPTGGFDQTMMIYVDRGGVRADYVGEGHVLHYRLAAVSDGRSVEFMSEAEPGAPRFRLTYTADGAGALGVAFAIEPPGAAQFQPIAVGRMTRSK